MIVAIPTPRPLWKCARGKKSARALLRKVTWQALVNAESRRCLKLHLLNQAMYGQAQLMWKALTTPVDYMATINAAFNRTE